MERVMKSLSLALLIPLAAVLGACSTAGTPMSATEIAQDTTISLLPESPRETVLLVSRNDGSVVMQTIYSSADFCFKKTSDSSTTCLRQGEHVVDHATNTVIGFEMIEEHIDLVAKTD